MTYRIVPRTEIGLDPVVRNSDGSVRPPLWDEPMLTAHYTGNNIDYTGKDAGEVVRQIQQVFSTTKPNEYNYCIGQNEDDKIIEYAGKFQAAHSAGENSIAFGVLFLLGVGEDPTPTMINKYRWLRDVLIYSGHLRVNVDQRMHFQMPGAATACPGNIKGFWPEFLKPFAPATPPAPLAPQMPVVAPIVQEDGTMIIGYIATPPTVEGNPNPPWLLRIDGDWSYLTSEDHAQATAKGLKEVPLNFDQYRYAIQSAGLSL